MSSGAQYVVAAYGVVLVAVLVYVVVVAMRTARIGREAELLARLVEREPAEAAPEPPPVGPAPDPPPAERALSSERT